VANLSQQSVNQYPVPRDSFPADMPVDVFHLITNGHLMATERAEYGWKQMMCATCGDRPVDLIWKHDPLPTDFFTCKGKKKIIPGMVWGEDVTVICPCCSILAMLGKCPHRSSKQGVSRG
jgi:hypothetical protein